MLAHWHVFIHIGDGTNTVCKCLEWSSVLDSTCRCCVLVLLMKSFTERPACTRVVASDVTRCLPNTKHPLHSLYFDFQHHGFSKPFCRLSRRYWQLIVLIRVLCATFCAVSIQFGWPGHQCENPVVLGLLTPERPSAAGFAAMPPPSQNHYVRMQVRTNTIKYNLLKDVYPSLPKSLCNRLFLQPSWSLFFRSSGPCSEIS